jgi:hypothetical protein
MLQQRHHAQSLGVVVETAVAIEAFIEGAFAGMAERRMAEIVRQRQRLGEVFLEAEPPRQRPGDLRYLERMRQPGPVMIALVEHEYLGLVLEAAERGGMDHPVAVAAERAAALARRLVELPSPAAGGIAGIRLWESCHSDRHGVLVPIPVF